MNRVFLLSFIALGLMACNNKDEDRTSIIGSWNCEEFSDIYGQRIYQTNIIRNPVSNATNEYIVSNFHNMGLGADVDVYITEIEPGKLTIAYSTDFKISFIGGGTVADDFSTINWSYKVNDGVNNPEVRSTYH